LAEVALVHLGSIIDEHRNRVLDELKGLYLSKETLMPIYMAKVGELSALDLLKEDLNTRVKVGRKYEQPLINQ